MRKLGDIFQDKSGQCRGNTNLIFIHSTQLTKHLLVTTPNFLTLYHTQERRSFTVLIYLCHSWARVNFSLGSSLLRSLYHTLYCTLYTCTVPSTEAGHWLRLCHSPGLHSPGLNLTLTLRQQHTASTKRDPANFQMQSHSVGKYLHSQASLCIQLQPLPACQISLKSRTVSNSELAKLGLNWYWQPLLANHHDDTSIAFAISSEKQTFGFPLVFQILSLCLIHSHHFLFGCLVTTDDLHAENYPGALVLQFLWLWLPAGQG